MAHRFCRPRGGEILLFEANATMVVIPLAPDQKWSYRRPAFDAVFTAVRDMLVARAARLETPPRTRRCRAR